MISAWATVLSDSRCDDCQVRLRNDEKDDMCTLCIQRMEARDYIANFHANRDPMHAAICGEEDVDERSSITSHSVMPQENECLFDASAVQSVCCGRKRPQRPGQKVNLTRIAVLDSQGRPMVDDTGRQMQKVRIAGQATNKTIKPLKPGEVTIGDTPEACVEEFRQRMRHAGYGEGTSKDGSLYKYSRAMARLFSSDGFFSSRDDFFREGAREAAYEIFMKIAKDKVNDPNNKKKIEHEMRCLKHGFDDFVMLVSRQTA